MYIGSQISILGLSDCDLDIHREKWLNYLQTVVAWLDVTFFDVWFGSALFANNPFRGLQTKMCQVVCALVMLNVTLHIYLYIISWNMRLVVVFVINLNCVSPKGALVNIEC